MGLQNIPVVSGFGSVLQVQGNYNFGPAQNTALVGPNIGFVVVGRCILDFVVLELLNIVVDLVVEHCCNLAGGLQGANYTLVVERHIVVVVLNIDPVERGLQEHIVDIGPEGLGHYKTPEELEGPGRGIHLRGFEPARCTGLRVRYMNLKQVVVHSC